MADLIQIRRDTKANWDAVSGSVILAEGEMGIITDVSPKQVKIGDGTGSFGELPAQSWVDPEKLDDYERKDLGYVLCTTGASTAAKTVIDTATLQNFELSENIRLLVKMTNTNTASGSITLEVNETSAKSLYYNGAAASDTNTWAAGEVLDVYYDGTKYVANTHGGAQFATGEKVGDVGIDDEPTADSDNLVKSGGVMGKINDFSFFMNVNLYNNVPNTAYADKETARLAIPTQYRKYGLIITYLLDSGWVVERNNYKGSGNIASDAIWKRDSNVNILSWITISEGNYTVDEALARIGYFWYKGHKITSSDSVSIILGGDNVVPYSYNNPKRIRVVVNSENYSKLTIRTFFTDGTDSFTHLTSNDFVKEWVKDIESFYVAVKENQDDDFDVEVYYGISEYLLSQIDTVKNRVIVVENVIEDIDDTLDILTELNPVVAPVSLTIKTVEGVNGYWMASSGGWVSDNTRRGSEKISVVPGEKYLITTKIGASTAIAYLGQWNNGDWVGIPTGFTGGSGDAVDKEYIVPTGVDTIAICSYNTTNPSLKKVTYETVSKSYTKTESDARYAVKSFEIGSISKYGVKWSISDFDDLGTRVFGAVGKTATIGIGSTNGSSDFDNIYPWSEIKRCNIKYNTNGARVVTFEDETGFALDGTNGDVFVRIPKFKTNHYVENGYEYIIIGEGCVHPAFIEDGVELDEIFVGAFEAYKSGDDLYSQAGVIPTNNITAADFLAAAKHRGNNYTLADMRSVDAIWKLMAVEYGCRNSNRVFGYGYSDFEQPVNTISALCVSVAVQSSNILTGGKPSNNSGRVAYLTRFAPGNNITICDGTQGNIVAQRKITDVQCASTNDNIVITFDGTPLDLTTTMFFGNAACDTNYCESITSVGSNYALSWHTGRANRPVGAGSGLSVELMNPCRYRWIENPVGNLWQFLPDITFYNLQMYVCKNMKDYVMHKHESPYLPIGPILPIQNSNGYKPDVNSTTYPNYWVTSLLNDIFAKGNNFGKTFDTVHDGTITSQKGFGGYYYLYGVQDTPYIISNGGGFDHAYRSNILTNRAWQHIDQRWYLYGARLMYKNLN